ncbi:putative fluoride ion transporter CrcB [Porphyridium purpureum]|uniref:Putative fluoride ion transporter CrcB n=1 Tax=Porphyridium purpureum TaxID=35688 RepID=A0A5J4Z5Q1_PORPP|nr:putative fluoride ion transporter CrcB [Porphyridium purpureum]|eukprot:POR4723..scf295_1
MLRTVPEWVVLSVHLVAPSVLGTISRAYVEILFGPTVINVTSNTSAVFLDLPVNALGSFLMGVVHHEVVKGRLDSLHPHLVHMIGTAFMGSLTTFASWNFQVVQMFIAGNWVGAFFALIIGTHVAFMSFMVGRQLVHIVGLLAYTRMEKSRAAQSQVSPVSNQDGAEPDERHSHQDSILSSSGGAEFELDSRFKTSHMFIFSSVFAAVTWGPILAACFIDHADPSRQKIWIAAALAPIGTMIRWQLSFLNTNSPKRFGAGSWFPLGTFLTNVGATMLDALVQIPQVLDKSDTLATKWIGAVSSGIMGCMSTVSTWIKEIAMLYAKALAEENPARSPHIMHNWIYALATLVAAQILGILIYGTAVWTT